MAAGLNGLRVHPPLPRHRSGGTKRAWVERRAPTTTGTVREARVRDAEAGSLAQLAARGVNGQLDLGIGYDLRGQSDLAVEALAAGPPPAGTAGDVHDGGTPFTAQVFGATLLASAGLDPMDHGLGADPILGALA